MSTNKEKIPLDTAEELAPNTAKHDCGEKGRLQCGQTFVKADRRYFDFVYLCSNCGKYFIDNRKSL